MDRLKAEFFQRSPVDCARELIGARFVWHGCEGRIVETEAYASNGDPACHTFFRPSARAFVEAHAAGAAYVYLNYGVHWLFNVLVKGPECAGFVLFRALEPLVGIDRMRERRGRVEIRELCSGPGKLTRALGIAAQAHGQHFLEGCEAGLFREEQVPVVASERIGISRGRELLWRFHVPQNPHVSR